MVIDPDRPWAFLVPDQAFAKKIPKSPPRVHKHSAGTVFQDISATTYLIQADAPVSVPLDLPHSLSPSHSYIPDSEEAHTASHCVVRPLASATLLRVPAGTDYTSISTIHLHLLHSTSPLRPSLPSAERTTLEEVAQNYHDLSLLAKLRWKLRANPALPFHLAALEVMSTALTCDESLTD